MPRRNGLPTFPGCQKVGSPLPLTRAKARWQAWRPSPSSRSGQGPGLQSGTWKGCGEPVLMCPFAITRMGVMANGVEPMKLGLVADIHGDPVALELAWAHLITMKVDRIVCAGDLVGYGPFPDRVVAFVKERQIPSVRGNHDRWAVSRGPGAVDELGGGKPSLETLEYQPFQHVAPCIIMSQGNGLRPSKLPRQGCIPRHVLVPLPALGPMPVPTLVVPGSSTVLRNSSLSHVSW